MRLSTRGRYAVMALVELAARDHERLRAAAPAESGIDASTCPDAPPCGPVSLAEIAAAQLLSVAYLEQLFARLRRAGLVDSARGPGGGYRLALPPEQISIGTIIDAVDEPLVATRCETGGSGCLGGKPCLTHDLWHELGEQIRLFLLHTSLADVIHGRICGRALPPAEPDRR